MNNSAIFAYSELLPCLHFLRENVEGNSYSQLAKAAKLNSRTKIRRIFKGELCIPKLALSELAKNFGLNQTEQQYLELLRCFEQAVDPQQAWCFGQKILQLKRKFKIKNENSLSEEQLCLLENWYTIPLLHYFELFDVKKDVASLVKAFHGQVTPVQIEMAIEELIHNRLLKRRESGDLEITTNCNTLLDDLPRPLLKKYHSMMMAKAQESMERPRDQRFLLSSTLPVRKSMIPLIREKLVQLTTDLDAQYCGTESEEVHQLNIQFFQLMEGVKCDSSNGEK